MLLAMHLCRGNFKSTHAAAGNYEPVAEALLKEMDLDAYFMEYDDDRSGDFRPLRYLPKGKTVVLGLVTTKFGELEEQGRPQAPHRRGGQVRAAGAAGAVAAVRLLQHRARQQHRRRGPAQQAAAGGRDGAGGVGRRAEHRHRKEMTMCRPSHDASRWEHWAQPCGRPGPVHRAGRDKMQSWPLGTPRRTGIHDVAPAPDGGVWFTAQRSGHLGWFDPTSGRTELIALGSGSSPHGVIQGPDKAAWITDGGQNAIVRVGWPDREVQRVSAARRARPTPT